MRFLRRIPRPLSRWLRDHEPAEEVPVLWLHRPTCGLYRGERECDCESMVQGRARSA